MRTLIAGVVATVGVAATLASCGSSSSDGAASTDVTATPVASTQLQEAYDSCYDDQIKWANARGDRLGDGQVLELADEGHTIIATTVSEDSPKIYLKALACVMVALDVPTSVTTRMDSTTSLMGAQTGDDGSLHYQWSYHPDNGLQVVITED